MIFLDTVILLAILLSLAALRTPILIWTILVGLVLVIVTFLNHFNLLFIIFCWLLFISAALFAHLKKQRIQYIVKPLIQTMQKQMPTISRTEREAIEAGNVWWEKELFAGRPKWKPFLAMPTSTLTQAEQAFLENQVETLCGMLDDWQIVTQDKDMPKEVWDYLKQERFFGLVIPKEYGGHGFSALTHSNVVIKIASRSISAAVNTMVPNSLGPGELLVHYGTDEQKNYYLPRLAHGEEIPCFALTAPEAGSDAGSITDSGIVCQQEYNGQQTLGMKLTWDKRYITLAPVATLLGLAFRLYDPDHLLGEKEDIGITLCLIPTHLPGVEIGDRHWPLHLAFMNGPTRGHDVFVPLNAIIGGPSMAGQGWRMLMECLSIGRSISLPALSTASAKLAYRMTGAYAKLRKQFNTSIAHFEGIEEALSYIAGYTYLLEAARIMTVSAVDQHIKPAIASAIAKYTMTEMARHIISKAMDIQAGYGIQVGPRNFLAHPYLSIPVSITVEGANILTRNLIIFGQGAIRCHPYILREIELFSEKNAVDTLDNLLLSHLGYVLSNLARSFSFGITGGYIAFSPIRGPVARYYRQLTRMSTALALLSDLVMLILGGSLKRKERISARLADILSQLYLASAVLKYYQDQGQPTTDLIYVKWSVEMCLYEMQVACDELFANFPIRWLGKLLRGIIFPWGVAYSKPKDRLSHDIVQSMLAPTALRERLTQEIYIAKPDTDAMRRIETAFHKMPQIDELGKKFQLAIRQRKLPCLGTMKEQLKAAVNAAILTESEAEALAEFNQLYKEVIKVNEFSFDLNSIVI